MGTDVLQSLAEGAYSNETPPRQTLRLEPGNRGEQWEEFINMRLQDDGPYAFWKKRGGSAHQFDVTGEILTLYAFTATVSGTQRDYVAIHTDSGHAYLWEEGTASPTQIFTSIFNTTEQVSILANGIFLYFFDFENEISKVYNLEEDTSADWIDHKGPFILDYSWIDTDTRPFREQNLWGIEEGGQIGFFYDQADGGYTDPETGNLSFRPFIAEIDNIRTGGNFDIVQPNGDIDTTANIDGAIFPNSPDLQSLLDKRSKWVTANTPAQGSIEVINFNGNIDFAIDFGGTIIPETGAITSTTDANTTARAIYDALSSDSSIASRWNVIWDSSNDRVEVVAKTDTADLSGIDISIEYYEDPGTLMIKTIDTHIDHLNYGEFNDEWTPIPLFRGYMLVDIFDDGSISMPGKPIVVRTYISDILSDAASDPGRAGVSFTITNPAAGIAQRRLYATRWQLSEEDVFRPSRPEYPDSAWFFVRDINGFSPTIEDFTPDSELIEPLSATMPLNSGIGDMFGPGQITPQSVANMDGTLMIGGYSVDRFIPEPYADFVTDLQSSDNIFVNIISGTEIPEPYEVAFMFQYTDGKYSDLVRSGETLTDGEEVLFAGTSATSGTALNTLNVAPGGAGSDGDISIEYEGNTVSTPFTAGDDDETILDALAADINADGSIGLSANRFTSLGIEIIEFVTDATGNSVNGNEVEGSLLFDTTGGIGSVEWGDNIVIIEGAENAQDSIERSANQVHIHGLNSLISKIFVLAEDSSGTLYLLEEVDISDAQAHGMTLLLPNSETDILANDTFTVPGSTQRSQSQDLFNWVVPAVPFQQPRISEQTKIEDQSRIQRIIPTQYDSDKTQMRYRLTVFTDRNLQVGYIVFGTAGIESDFEIIGEGVEIAHRFGSWYVAGQVIFQSRAGIHIFDGSSYPVVIDKREYDLLANNLQRVVYNRQWGEYWMFFDGPDNKILAFDPQEQAVRSFIYDSSFGTLRVGTHGNDEVIIGLGDGLYYSDLESQVTDEGTPIDGEMILRHMGNQTIQTKILEINVGGQGYNCEIALDQQKARLEGSTTPWTKDFIEDFTTAIKELRQQTASYQFHKRAVMPKVKFKITGDAEGFVSLIDIKYIETSNTGRARLT